MDLRKPTMIIGLTGVTAVGLGFGLPASPASADSGVINSAGNDCSGQWLSGPNQFRIRDNAGGSDDDYCYIDYGGSAGSVGRRISHPEDCCVGSWRNYNPDLSGIGASSLYFKVCEERENDPDLCSNVHGPYAK